MALLKLFALYDVRPFDDEFQSEFAEPLFIHRLTLTNVMWTLIKTNLIVILLGSYKVNRASQLIFASLSECQPSFRSNPGVG